MKQLANILTLSRLVLAVSLLFLPAFSPAFYAVYGFCGFTDMIDGTVARKTGSADARGEKLDSIADGVMVFACAWVVLPKVSIPAWLYAAAGVVVLIRLWNVLWSAGHLGRITMLHTKANRLAGLMLFSIPLLLRWIPFALSGAVTCAVALYAALDENDKLKNENR